MGRHKKYLTPEDKRKANSEKALAYYKRNKDEINQKRKEQLKERNRKLKEYEEMKAIFVATKISNTLEMGV